MRPLLSLAVLLLALVPAAVTHAQSTPYPVVLTMTGPATAVSGDEISYRVHYRLTNPSVVSHTSFRIRVPQNTTHVSSRVVSGPPGVLVAQYEGFVDWGGLGNASEPEGEVEILVKINADFVGSIFADAYIPGTETAQSNAVETHVFAPGTLPKTGSGSNGPGHGSALAPALLGLLGVALVGVGACICRQRARSTPAGPSARTPSGAWGWVAGGTSRCRRA
jgi:hypothetical protein